MHSKGASRMVIVITATETNVPTTKSYCMKTPKPILILSLILLLLLVRFTAVAQAEQKVPLTEKLVVYFNPVQSQLVANNPAPGEYDKLTIYDMRGAPLLQQNIKTSTIRVDISSLEDGVYLLVLRTSATGKEKSIKFVVRK
jgi:hypothetical protein